MFEICASLVFVFTNIDTGSVLLQLLMKIRTKLLLQEYEQCHFG
jgi:hypothetical protein